MITRLSITAVFVHIGAVAVVQEIHLCCAFTVITGLSLRKPRGSHGAPCWGLSGSSDDLSDLHRAVAEQDADWYEQFIADVLGEDARMGDSAALLNSPGPIICVDGNEYPSSTSPREKGVTIDSSNSNTSIGAVNSAESDKTVGSIDKRKTCERESGPVGTDLNSESSGTIEPAQLIQSLQQKEPVPSKVKRAVESRIASGPPVGTSTRVTTDVLSGDVSVSGKDAPSSAASSTITEGSTDSNRTKAAPESLLVIPEKIGNSTEASSDYSVLYRDLYNGSLKAVPLSAMTTLGYTEDEIPYLQVDALALILSDKIRRPSRGIPQQWKLSESQYEVLSDDIRIVPSCDATNILEAAKEKQVAKLTAPATNGGESIVKTEARDSKCETGTGGTTLRRSEESSPPQVDDRLISRSKVSVERRDRQREARRPSSDLPDRKRRRRGKDYSKRIYNARESDTTRPRVEEDDPPPPKGPLWVDIDSFRDLLRSEAELRVRILGEDWADVVKEESSWRLRLYKEWLWTLDRGWGSPFIPSRSERARTSRKGRPVKPRSTPRERRQTEHRRAGNSGQPRMPRASRMSIESERPHEKKNEKQRADQSLEEQTSMSDRGRVVSLRRPAADATRRRTPTSPRRTNEKVKEKNS